MTNRKFQITEITLRYIEEKGFSAFSYDDLAKEMNVTKASIHYHFEKKGDLGIAVCERIRERLDTIFSKVNQTQTKAEDKPLLFLSKIVQFTGSNGINAISALQADFNFLPVSMQQKIKQVSQLEINYLVKLLKESKHVKNLQSVKDTESLAAILLSAIKGGQLYGRTLGETFPSKLFEQLKLFLN